MTPPAHPPDPPPPRDDDELSSAERTGADLLAHVRGELDPARRAEIDALLAGSPELRRERERLSRDDAAWRAALQGAGLAPRPGGLDRLLGLVAEEAAERRAERVLARSPVDAELGADLVALALGQLSGDERERVERAAAREPRLRAEVEAALRFAHETREALRIEPSARAWEALRTSFRADHVAAAEPPYDPGFDTQDVPIPTLSVRGRGRVLRWAAPLAAAAAVAAIALFPRDPEGAVVTVGQGILEQWHAGAREPGLPRPWVSGTFRFENDEVLEAALEPLTVRVACGAGAAPPVSGALPDGCAEFALDPGARLRRRDESHFELLAGRVTVQAERLGDALEISSGALFARVRGTRFAATAAGGRLVAVVAEGEVELGRDSGPEPRTVLLRAGDQGLVDAERLLVRDAASGTDAFLAPRAELELGATPRAGAPLELEAVLVAGDAGAVEIASFDDALPLFTLRLRDPAGRTREIKLQRSMLAAPAPVDPGDTGVWRLDGDRPYRLRLRVAAADLEPGAWEARLLYTSYRTRSRGAEWLGHVESAALAFEVPPR